MPFLLIVYAHKTCINLSWFVVFSLFLELLENIVVL